jgi:Histidine kinase-, DNA gyrase B-, and HSP90-like ATPase
MISTALSNREPNRCRVDADLIRIGKDVIEILTSGMYVSPITIYREYLQNAADSIDVARAQNLLSTGRRGRVTIRFDHSARSVVIRDNGAGLAAHEAASTLLAIGGSAKRGTAARGFRGVGRLSGLAYCQQLEFRTKAVGERTTTSVVWHCRELRDRLSDHSFRGDLRSIISDVVSLRSEISEDESEHFFEVRLSEIVRLRNDVLLNEHVIGQYLSEVAPVPFSPEFSFGRAIYKRLAAHSTHVPIDLTIEGNPINRPYQDRMEFPGTSRELRIEDVEFIDLADVDGRVGAVGWIAHHEYIRSLPSALGVRGLRGRYGDVQVGDWNLFENCFKEPRFDGWCIGELHVLDRRITPNARRDNFEANHHYANLLVQLGPVAARIAQRCRSASVSRNAEQIVLNVIAEIEARLKQKRGLDRAELSRSKSATLRAQAKLRGIADEKKRERLQKKLERLKVALAKVSPKRGVSVVALDEAAALISRLVTNRDQAQKLIEELRRRSG